jgi:hypothetical protein
MLTGENVTVAGKDQVKKLPKQLYEQEMYRLQGELVKMQERMPGPAPAWPGG